MTADLKMFYDLIQIWRSQHHKNPKSANGVFRGITGFMPGFHNVVGVTRNALVVMNDREWKGNFAKGLRRDHMKATRDFQAIIASREISYEEFCALIADYGRCVICTKEENPSKTAGYGHTYSDDDILWFSNKIETHTDFATPTNASMMQLLKTASSENPALN